LLAKTTQTATSNQILDKTRYSCEHIAQFVSTLETDTVRTNSR